MIDLSGFPATLPWLLGLNVVALLFSIAVRTRVRLSLRGFAPGRRSPRRAATPRVAPASPSPSEVRLAAELARWRHRARVQGETG